MVNLMMFSNFNEFLKRRKTLRIYYIFLTDEEIKEYKKYIYSLEYKENVKDMIWQYFNEGKGSPYYVFEYQVNEIARLYARNKNNIRL